MRKHILLIGFSVGLAFIIIFGLGLISERPNDKPNGFTRNILDSVVVKIDTASFKNKFRRICSIHNSHLFFENDIPGNIYRTDTSLKYLDSIQINLLSINGLSPVFYTAVFYPKLYILGGNIGRMIEADLKTDSFRILCLPKTFSKGIMYKQNKFLLKEFNPSDLTSELVQYSFFDTIPANKHLLFNGLKYAGFIYDGQFRYDPYNDQFIYVSYYSNNVICFDSSLSIKFRAHTIDTFNTPKVVIGGKGKSITRSRPPTFVNNEITYSNNNLLVYSNLKADNENKPTQHVSIIDIYSTDNWQYKGSFYLDNIFGEQLINMYLDMDRLYVLFKHHIVCYQLNLKQEFIAINR